MKTTDYQNVTNRPNLWAGMSKYFALLILALGLFAAKPAFAQIPDTVYTCKDQRVNLSFPRSGKDYRWSTGDTGRTISVTLSSDSIIYCYAWVGPSPVDSFYWSVYVKVLKDCVYPGDANEDFAVDIDDVLAVGVAYGATGPTRPMASSNWQGQICNNWASTFASGANYKFADCNGDGTVDSVDLDDITLNWQYSHGKTTTTASGAATDPPLYFTLSKDSAEAGDTITAFLYLGTKAIPANNIYGVWMELDYGNDFMGPNQVRPDFGSSWLGTLKKDMISFGFDDWGNRRYYTCLSRINQKNNSGYGQIGKFTIMMPDNIGGKREVTDVFKLNIGAYKCISISQNLVSLNPTSNSIKIYQFKNGIAPNMQRNIAMELYPNPAHQSVHIKASGGSLQKTTIEDMLGHVMAEKNTENLQETELDISSLPTGMYIVRTYTTSGMATTRFVKE